MVFRLVWDAEAVEDLRRIDRTIAQKIKARIETYLVQDPANIGKRLTGDKSHLYSYRYGDYRILYEIAQDVVTITVVRVGHRREVYDG